MELLRSQVTGIFSACLVFAGTLMYTSSVVGHHGTRVSYDPSKTLVLTGTVTEFVVRNPHSFVMFDVPDDDGNIVPWGVEMASLSALMKMGVSPDTLQAGDEITLSLNPSYAGTPRGVQVLREPILINGVVSEGLQRGTRVTRRVTAQRSEGDGVEFDPRDLSGVWFTDMRVSVTAEEDGARVTAAPAAMTERGKAKYDSQLPSYGPRAVPPGVGNDPGGECNPWGLVRTIVDGLPMEWIHGEDKVIQLFETGNAWRNIYTDGREMPVTNNPRWFGYSVGHWEGNTLVVETENLDDRVWLDRYANPASEAMRVVERWTRVAHETLELEMTLHDPEIYTEAIELAVITYELQPGADLDEWICAPLDESNFNEKIRDPASGRDGVESGG